MASLWSETIKFEKEIKNWKKPFGLESVFFFFFDAVANLLDDGMEFWDFREVQKRDAWWDGHTGG